MLYQQVQNDLNGLPGKHLDFFYKEVLGLKTRPASPDKVHLFFELAKNIPAYELLANIRFKAGKDDTGKNLFYALDKNTVLSAAQVESLHTVFLDLEGDINTQSRKVKNIHVAPVANSGDGLGAPVKDKENPSWATLGSTQMPPASLGIAIASNELLLGEGTRQITLLIYPTKSAPADLSPRLDIYLSGKKGWIPVETYTAAVDASDPAAIKPIKITCTLGPEAPPILPFNAKIFKENLGTMLPVMKLLLHQPKSGEAAGHYDYEALRQLKIYKVQLEVDVKNLQQIVAFSDEGAVDATKPFMPFGSNPKVGSSFYVGHAEAFQKSLDKVTLKLVWEGVPKNFSTHYRGYDLALENNAVKMAPSDFGIKTFVLKNGTPQEITGTTDSTILFGSVTNDTVDPMGVINHSHQLNITTANLGHAFPPDNIANYGLTPKNGFLRIDLQRDFEHDQFQNVLTRQMLAAAKLPAGVAGAYYDTSGAVAKATSNVIAANAEVIIPKAPYTPVLKSVTLDYTSMVNTADDAADLHVLHLYPFANTYQYLAFPNPRPEKTEAPFLLPQFTTKQTDPSVDREEVDPGMAAGPLPVTAAKKTGPKGSVAKFSQLPSPLPQPTSLEQGALLIGLRQLQPLDSLSLLFQVAENSADAEIPKAKLRWHYLAGNKWLAFQDYQIASDTTDELTTSGIVALSIPEDINRENTILSPELHWLKISVTQHVGAVSRLLNVHTQAVRATFQENGNDPARFATPLVAQTIAKLEVADSALKSISQPYESFGGQPAEAPLRFYTRVSERLRHKGRAITQFDYERLVLDAFPTIYKVKCVNHTDQQ